MSDYINFGIIKAIDPNKNYADISGGPAAFHAALEEYRCISVSDGFVNCLIPQTMKIPTFYCSLDNPGVGIDHYGVTLIPPESVVKLKSILASFASRADESEDAGRLLALLDESMEQNLYIICFGI